MKRLCTSISAVTLLLSAISKVANAQLSTRKTSISFSLSQTARGLSLTVKKTITLTRELFDYDVIMKDHPASKAVTLKKSDGDFVKLSFPHSDCIAVWTSTGDPDAQFICLEPWTSVPVYEDDAFEDIENKPHAIKLAPEAVYTYSYTVGRDRKGLSDTFRSRSGGH